MKLSGNSKIKKTKKGEKTMKKIIISMILTLSLLSVFSYGYFVFNWPCLLYNGQCPPANSSQSSIQSINPSLGQLSIEAAGFFLQSNSDFQAFLKKIELSEIYGSNYADLIDLIIRSIENMQIANSLYYQVWNLSKNLEHNPVIIKKLKKFDYGLILEEKKMIPSIFNKVEKFLKHGNMSGAFEKMYNDTDEILKFMESLKTIIEENSIDIPLCWDVNQRLLESELFGQYISQVFSKIRDSLM